MNYKIIDATEELAENIIQASDSYKEALGFLKRGTILDKIYKKEIWVLLVQDEYAGHLMWGGRFPKLKIVQMYIDPKLRGNNFASKLLDKLKKYGEQNGFSYISARVASDLKANSFWSNQKFIIIKQIRGGETTNRIINIYEYKLKTPGLFQQKIALHIKETPFSQLEDHQIGYALDLNIFHETIEKRSETQGINKIFKLAENNACEVYVTPEIYVELKRNKQYPPSDIDSFIKKSKALPNTQRPNQNLISELQLLLFPKKNCSSKDWENILSDCNHIAYCITNLPMLNISFVTLERKILIHSNTIREKYGLNIISPNEFIDIYSVEDTEAISVSPLNEWNEIISICQIKENQECEFLYADKVVASLSWEILGVEKRIKFTIFITDEISVHKIMNLLIEVINKKLSELAPGIERAYIKLADENLLIIQNILRNGFEQPKSEQNVFVKLVFPNIVFEENWPALRKSFHTQRKILLPEKITTNKNSFSVSINEQEREWILNDFESYLLPSQLCIKDRGAIIIPIKHTFGKDLIEQDRNNPTLFPVSENTLKIERAYFRTTSRHSYFSLGKPVLFYESGPLGRGLLGVARILESQVIKISDILESDINNGVLSIEDLKQLADKNGEIHQFTFEAFKSFDHYLPYSELKLLGVGKASFVSPEEVGYQFFEDICRRGFNRPPQDILLPIHPKYTQLILSGHKKVEIRRRFPEVHQGSRIWIYSTSPDQKILALAHVNKIHKYKTIEDLWDTVGTLSCLNKKDFEAYLNGSASPCGIELSNVIRLKNPLKLKDITSTIDEKFTPPQSFRYVRYEDKLSKVLERRLLEDLI